MLQCWYENPEDRPSFAEIRGRLETMMQKDKPYVDLIDVNDVKLASPS